MKITSEDIDRLAHLSRLNFTQEEKKKIRVDLEQILSYMEKLKEVDTEKVEPLSHLTDHSCPLREDVSRIELSRKQALRNAPQSDKEHFLLPKIIDKNI